MKKILAVLFIFIASASFAQRAFVRQNVISRAYYTIDSVFLTAQSGDTIYLPGGSFQINNLYIDHRLTIYGAGHYPDSTQATYATTLNGSIFFRTGSSNSVLSGIYLTGSIQFGTNTTNETVSNISITRCNVTSILMGSNYWGPGSASFINVRENVVRGEVRGCNAQFVSIEKNIINGNVSFFNTNMLARNNIFLGGSGCPAYGTSEVYNCTFENNIFMLSSGCGEIFFSSSSSNIFTKNLFNGNLIFPVGSNIGTGNYVNVPFAGFFVNETDYVFDYNSNYHLQNPGSYLGTDGTQVGIYGTSSPYKPSAVPSNPHIRTVSIPNSTDINGNLNINIITGAQQQ